MNKFIRKAEKRDASRLAEILIFTKRCTYRPIFCDDYVSFNEMQVLDLALEYKEKEGAIVDLFVYDDGIVKGLLHTGITKCMEQTEDVLKESVIFEIKELYVDNFFIGQGIGKALMMEGINMAYDAGAEAVRLLVLEKNTAARGFYESFGFHVTGEKEKEAGTPEFLLQYHKSLL